MEAAAHGGARRPKGGAGEVVGQAVVAAPELPARHTASGRRSLAGWLDWWMAGEGGRRRGARGGEEDGAGFASGRLRGGAAT
jgi:hypothetical protein